MSEYRRFLMESSMKNSSWDIEWKSGESIPNGISGSYPATIKSFKYRKL